MADEKTFVMIKPDGIQRRLLGEIIGRFERKGLKLAALKMMKVEKELAEKHYEVHKDKFFYKDLITFITSAPVAAMVWAGENAVFIVRQLVGETSPDKAKPGTIRGDYVIDTTFNIIHASDSTGTAKKEIGLFFSEAELLEYHLTVEKWLKPDEN